MKTGNEHTTGYQRCWDNASRHGL